MIHVCNRCGKRFASQASVRNHQKQLSSKCWKTYSLLLLDLQQQSHIETKGDPSSSLSLPSSPSESTPPPLDVDMDSPPPTPSSLPMEIVNDIDQPPQLEQEAVLPSFHTELFLGSSKVFGNGETYLDLFNEDEYADARQTNLYYPFASKPEWELASFLLKSDLSRVAIDQFLKLQLVSTMQSIELSPIYMSFRFRASEYHSKLPKTLAIALKFCQLSSLTFVNPTLDKICSGFLILDKVSAGYRRRLILKVLPRTMLFSIIEIHCFVSNISCIAHLSRTIFHFRHSNFMKMLQRL
jgi:hypothetical protein